MPADAIAITVSEIESAKKGASSPVVQGPRHTPPLSVPGTEERMAGHSTSSRVDDTVLIREAQRGNRAAFEDLVRQYDRAVLRLALHLTGSESDAQDIYQEAFLKAYRNLGSFRFECSFYTWIYRIVSNLCLDLLRKRQVRKEDSPVVVDEDGAERSLLDTLADERSGADPERDLLSRELRERIARGLAKLTPRERMVFELKHYQGLKLRTVGEILNTTEETAKNTLFRATQKMRAALADMK
jgi:RNA polymerase sigma-70 factor (ECF subfamily)